jgi:hypothetical protein
MRPVAFTHDGVDYKAWPEQGSYFGVGIAEAPFIRGKKYLLQVPMLADGRPAYYQSAPDACEVVNMHEPGDDVLLADINAEFDTAFKQSDFPGR